MNPLVVLAALFSVSIWGASPVAAKLAVESMSPYSVSILRTVLAGLIALPLAWILGIRLPATNKNKLLLVLSGFCGFVAFAFLLTIGVNLTSANHASLILASLPVTTGAIAKAWDKQWPSKIWWTGCTIAIIGECYLIFGDPGSAHHGATIKGDLIIFFANIFASLGYVIGGRLQQSGYSSAGTTFWGVGIWTLILIPFLPLFVNQNTFIAATTTSLFGLAYLAIGVTIIAYIAWYWCLGKGGIARIGTFQFLQPVTGVLAAWWLLSEQISPSFLAASILILIGVWVALKSK